MSKINVADLKSGMITASPVLTKNGQKIVDAGVTLDKRLIARLDFYSISSVEILAEGTSTAQEPSVETEPVKPIAPVVEENPVDRSSFLKAGNASNFQKIQRSDEFRSFQVSYSVSVKDVKDQFELIAKGEPINFNSFLASSMKILSEYHMTSIQLFDMLHNIRQVDDTIYAHCLNVAFIARVLGKWMKFDKEEINLLTLAGLLHDIGKTKIPSEILTKPEKLNEQELEQVRKHSFYSYDMLKNYNLPEKVLSAILHHHERCDGSGYPDHLPSERLDDFTMIIAIADVYDAMTAARSYRGPLCPFTVISNFEKEGLQKYRPHVILTFLERIANTYQNNRVLLNNGTQGTIIMLNSSHLSRPIIKLDNDEFLDLSLNSSLCITQIL